MKKVLIMVCAFIVLLAFAGVAFAVPAGKSVEYTNSKEGKVIFDGKKHADAKLACKECHPNPFAMKKAAKITQDDHAAGKFCGKCHDGTKAFDMKDCAKCHTK